ncbi:MAG: hypothetical protein HYV67_03645 [Candidatus Taylorbacteria bacterium]|nr:hypothetical protein [Candidatus Taylorbacteria bacterium]
MDYQKDINISPNSQDSKNLIVFKLFEKDNHLLFIYKKAERIVSALYLVTDFLSDNEPVKWQFRNIGTGIISQTLSLTAGQLSRAGVAHQLLIDMLRLLSLLDIAYVAGLISEMNFTVLKKELEHLLETLNFKGFPQSTPVGKKLLLDKEFFAVPAEQLTPSGASSGVFPPSHPPFPGNDFGRSETAVNIWSDANQNWRNPHKGQSKGHKYQKDKLPLISDNMDARSGNSYTSATDRQALITELLKSKKNSLTIKDFSLIIKGCSNKTIQRELLKLVRLGVLKKEGERRWSRYSLTLT